MSAELALDIIQGNHFHLAATTAHTGKIFYFLIIKALRCMSRSRLRTPHVWQTDASNRIILLPVICRNTSRNSVNIILNNHISVL